MNLKKWTSTLTLCAVTLACTAMPAAAGDTAFVGQATKPNLQAAADAMSAAMNQMNNGSSGGTVTTPGNNGSTQTPATGDTEAVGVDYVSLSNPAQTIDGQTYLPLRTTFAALKDAALTVDWKPEGQQKIKLTTSGGTSYEVYLTASEDGVQIQQGGTTYALKNVSGTTYVPLAFFQGINPNVRLGLSGSQILVLTAKSGDSVWSSNFWGNMNSYQAPVVEPEPEPTPEPAPTPTPEPEKPEVTYPTVDTPVVTPPTNDNNTGNSGSTGDSNSGNSNSGIVIGDSLLWPANSHYITSNYGYRIDPVGGILGDFHLGLDIAGSVGDPVYAAQGGTVIRASWFSTYGNCVDIQHPSGLVTRYAHLSAYHVSVGDTVSQGQIIADIGATGNVTGPHLHFETIVNGSTVDPQSYF